MEGQSTCADYERTGEMLKPTNLPWQRHRWHHPMSSSCLFREPGVSIGSSMLPNCCWKF